MGKTGDTKKRIYEMLEQRNKTLTDISNELGLAPSTVSQHLREMLDSGAIRFVEDRPRKWKYYEINRGYQIGSGYMQANNSQSRFDFRKIGVPVAVIAAVLVSVFAFYMVAGVAYANAQQVYLAPGSSVPSGSTVFSVSDAPSFYNISSLVVTVDNASIRSKSTGEWYNLPLQARTFDLVQLDNISSVLSGVKLSSGVYDELVLHISGVTASINGTVRPVVLPSGKLSIVGNFNISNGTTNWVNLDFDLAHSLHMTSNGTLIMLPVINIRHLNCSGLALNGSSIIVARSPGRIRELMEFGMDRNGTMVHNFSTPQNMSINEGPGGRLEIGGSAGTPIIIRARHDLIMGGDAANMMNATGFWTSRNRTINVPPNFGANVSAYNLNRGAYAIAWRNHPFGGTLNVSVQNGTGNPNTSCTYQNGALSCNPGSGSPSDMAHWMGQHRGARNGN
ncbi:MAG: DUF4382 domain-containing protein [Candidatus Micrarchaeaceae archaeon]|jgi:hypothetical protein